MLMTVCPHANPDVMRVCTDVTLLAVNDVVAIFITKAKGQRIASLVDNGTRVTMHISVGRQQAPQYSSINKTSVLFVSISFIVLMIISLAWLVFYYIQRFRYAHAKERLSVSLFCHRFKRRLYGACLGKNREIIMRRSKSVVLYALQSSSILSFLWSAVPVI
jgi:hypothetical protein